MDTKHDVVGEMRRFADIHWMHDEGQNVRMFADEVEKFMVPKDAILPVLDAMARVILEMHRGFDGSAEYGNMLIGGWATVLNEKLDEAYDMLGVKVKVEKDGTEE